MVLLPLLAAAALQGGAALLVACSPAEPERGARVTCTARLDPPRPATLVEKRASASGHARKEASAAPLPPGGVEWAGPAVVDTTVRFRVRLDGDQRELIKEARFTVRPRRWPAAVEFVTTPWEYGPDALFGGYPPPLAPGTTLEDPTPGRGSLGLTEVTLDNPGWAFVDEGPDAGWYYVTGPLTGPARYGVRLSRALRPDDPFFKLQHVEPLVQGPGSQRRLPMQTEATALYCDDVALDQLREQLLLHEGAKGDLQPNHRDEYRKVFTGQFTLQAELEAATGYLDDYLPPNPIFAEALAARIAAWLRARRDEQEWLERSASRVVLRCNLRYPAAHPQ